MHIHSAVVRRLNQPIVPITCFAVFLLLSLLLFVGTLGLSWSSVLFSVFLALSGPFACLFLSASTEAPQTKPFKEFTPAQRWEFVLMCLATVGTAFGGIFAGIGFAFGYPLFFFFAALPAFVVGIPSGAAAATLMSIGRNKNRA